MTRFFRRIPRPSLLWMSIDDVVRVRNQIIGIYLGPNEWRQAVPGESKERIMLTMSGSIPMFKWTAHPIGENYPYMPQAWLKVKQGKPCWDYQADPHADTETISFNDSRARIPAKVIKSWAKHFPYKPTDNYLVNGGQPIA